jgi:hypothetical protein
VRNAAVRAIGSSVDVEGRLQVVVCRVQVVSMHRRSSCAGLNVQQHSWLINVLRQLKRDLSI